MRKIFPKTVWCALTSVCIVMVLGACMKPIDVESFLDDPIVQEVIESTKGSVIIDPETLVEYPHLRAGSRRIYGLKSDKYYMIESVKDDYGVLLGGYPKYVNDFEGLGPGNVMGDLGVITKIRGGSINGLSNDYTYKVREATIFPDSSSFTYSVGDVPKNNAEYSNGTMTIPGATGNITLNLVSQLPLGTVYEVMAVAVPAVWPTWGATSKTSNDCSALPLEGPGTTVDYVIVNETVSPVEFRVLTVKISLIKITVDAIGGVAVPVAGEPPATAVSDTAEYTGTIAWSPKVTGTFAANTTYTATITLTPKTGYTLTGVGADSFTVTGATSVSNAANSGVITAVFPATDKITSAVFTITFSVSDMSITSSSFDPVSYSALADPSGSTAITFTLGGGDFSGVTWKLGNVDAGGNNTSLTIDKTSPLLPYLVPGTHVLNVKGIKDSDPNYSANITFTVSSN